MSAVFKRQMESLRRDGCEIEMFFLRSRTDMAELFRERCRLRTRIAEFRPNLVHANMGTMTAFFCVVSTRLPLIISYRGSDLNPRGPEDTFWRWLFGHVLSQVSALRAASIICVSKGVRSKLWWRLDRAHVMPTGVDPQLFRPMPREEARKRMGWGNGERVVLFSAGVTARNKGIELVLGSMEVARALCGEVRLEIMDGSTDPDDVPWAMNAADCLVFGSYYEGSPNVIKEAVSCNLPVISVEVGDVRERLDGVSPSVIVARDPKAMGAAVAEMLRRPVRSNGHSTIAGISEKAVAEKIMEIYRRAVRG